MNAIIIIYMHVIIIIILKDYNRIIIINIVHVTLSAEEKCLLKMSWFCLPLKFPPSNPPLQSGTMYNYYTTCRIEQLKLIDVHDRLGVIKRKKKTRRGKRGGKKKTASSYSKRTIIIFNILFNRAQKPKHPLPLPQHHHAPHIPLHPLHSHYYN